MKARTISVLLTLLGGVAHASDLSELEGARACAARLLAPTLKKLAVDAVDGSSIWVGREATGDVASLPIAVYRGQFTRQRPGVEVWFASDSTSCVLIRGDLNEMIGLPANFEAERSFAIVKFNERILQERRSDFGTLPDDALIAYSSAVLALVSPASSKLIRAVGDIPPTTGAPKRMGKGRGVDVKGPQVVRGLAIARVELDTWEAIGGVVWRNSVFVLEDGRVATSRFEVARGVGGTKGQKGRL